MAKQITTQNGTHTFNEYHRTDVPVSKPSIALYIKYKKQELANNDYDILCAEYVEKPATHYQTFNPFFMGDIDSTLILQTFQEEPSKEEIMRLKHILNEVKRTYPNIPYHLEN